MPPFAKYLGSQERKTRWRRIFQREGIERTAFGNISDYHDCVEISIVSSGDSFEYSLGSLFSLRRLPPRRFHPYLTDQCGLQPDRVHSNEALTGGDFSSFCEDSVDGGEWCGEGLISASVAKRSRLLRMTGDIPTVNHRAVAPIIFRLFVWLTRGGPSFSDFGWRALRICD